MATLHRSMSHMIIEQMLPTDMCVHMYTHTYIYIYTYTYLETVGINDIEVVANYRIW